MTPKEGEERGGRVVPRDLGGGLGQTAARWLGRAAEQPGQAGAGIKGGPRKRKSRLEGLRRPCTPRQLRLRPAALGDDLDAAIGWMGETEAGGQGWEARAECAGKDSKPNPALPKLSLVLSQCSRWETWLREERKVMKLEKGRAGI